MSKANFHTTVWISPDCHWVTLYVLVLWVCCLDALANCKALYYQDRFDFILFMLSLIFLSIPPSDAFIFFNTEDPIRCFIMCPAISADIEGDAFEGLILNPTTFAKPSSCTLMPCAGRQEVHVYYQDCSGPNSLYQGILWQPSQWWWSLSCYSLLFPIFISPHSFRASSVFRTKAKTRQSIILEAENLHLMGLIVDAGKELVLKSTCINQGSPKKVATAKEKEEIFILKDCLTQSLKPKFPNSVVNKL